MQNINLTLADSYFLALGRIVANLHSLEVLLRVFLHNVDKKRYGTPPPEVDLNKINVSMKVPENYFTNYDSLGILIGKYNSLVFKLGKPELRIDETLVALRDAIAHGRVLGLNPEPPLKLYKFGEPITIRDNASSKLVEMKKVPVVDIIDLTDARLKDEGRRVYGALMTVKKACEHFCPSVVG